jgi:hypothetical protein
MAIDTALDAGLSSQQADRLLDTALFFVMGE